jgi:hypothetical protein
VLNDEEAATKYLYRVEGDRDLQIAGSGTFASEVTQDGQGLSNVITYDVSQLCELTIWYVGEPEPPLDKSCDKVVEPAAWTLQVAAVHSEPDAIRELNRLERRGLTGLATARHSDWASICPATIIIHAGIVSALAAAEALAYSLRDLLPADAWLRALSNKPNASCVGSDVAAVDEIESPFAPASGSWGDWPKVTKREIALGDTGDVVRYLQGVLRLRAGQLEVQVDGEFGARTEQAVRRLQSFFGLFPDGKVGPRTWVVIDLLAEAPQPP